MCDTLKMAGRKAKRSEIWDPRTLVTHMWYMYTFDLVVFKAFGALRNSKTTGRRAKRSAIWESGILVIHI